MRQLFAAAVIVFVLTGEISAQLTGNTREEFTRAGTASAPFLKFAADARSAALGGAHSGIYGDVASLHWNPAGIVAVNGIGFTASQLDLFADISYNFVGAVIPLGSGSSLGISATYLNSGEMEETTVAEPEGTGIVFEVQSYAISTSYARYMTDNLMAGITLKYIREDIWLSSAQSVAFDVGTVLETGVMGIRLGMALTNLGPDMTMRGDNIETEASSGGSFVVPVDMVTESWPLPVAFRVGVALDLLGPTGQLAVSDANTLTVLADFSDAVDTFTRGNFGMEYLWNDMIALRSGYYYNYDELNISYGGGLVWSAAGYEFGVDYAFVDYGRLDFVNHFTLNLEF